MRTGSLVVISVVDVERMIRDVWAAMFARSTGGLAGATKGGLWCSPVANTSSPTSSAFLAISMVALIRSCSVGVRPVVGSGVTSPTVKMPNCMSLPLHCLWSLRIQLPRQRIDGGHDSRSTMYPLRGMRWRAKSRELGPKATQDALRITGGYTRRDPISGPPRHEL